MRTRRKKSCMLSFALLVGVMLIFNNAHGFMHCQSEDGHSRLERVSDTCCKTFDSSVSSCASFSAAEETFMVNQHNCGPCVDTPISKHFLNNTRKTTLFTQVITPTSVVVDQADLFGSVVPELNSASNASLSSIRTIILLV